MTMRSFDLAIIGAGTAGMAAYKAASAHGLHIALIESGPYGTLCARQGCMPSKLLLAAAEVAHQARTARRFGVHTEMMRIDSRAVMQRVHDERRRFVDHITHQVERWPATTRIKGRARFIDAHHVQVGDETISAQRFVIATGSAPVVPTGWRDKLGSRLVTSDEVFDWVELPRSLAVIGAGAIGLELAQAYSRLGVRVILLDQGAHVSPLTDPVVQARATELLGQQIDMHMNSQVLAMSLEGRRVNLSYTTHGRLRVAQVDHVLVAMGRRPVLADLNLEAAGLALDEHGMLTRVDEHTGRIGQSHFFVAGDARGQQQVLHEARFTGHMAGDNAARFPDVVEHTLPPKLSMVFCDPQIMVAGQSFHDLRDRAGSVACGMASFDDMGRGRIMGSAGGVIRLYADKVSETLLGAEMVGPGAEHIAHLLTWAIQHQVSVKALHHSPVYHPVLEEGLKPAIDELVQLLHVDAS
ncbi:MAG: dihydrolipoyl dehydrogenase [Aquabacterium sp.]